MGKATRSLSGASQKKYFRDLLNAAEGVPADAAEALGQTLEREIAQVRVRLPIPSRGDQRPASGKRKSSAAKATSGSQAPSTEPTAPSAAGFDPFAFSVVVAVTKEGRDGLMKRLNAITNPDDLKVLAKAQHVGVPETATSLDDLREAIAEGALQRIANRRAAAS